MYLTRKVDDKLENWETEMEEHITQLCRIISKRIGVSFATTEITLSIVTKLALAKTILEGVNNNPSSLPDLEKKNIITE